MTHAHPDDPHEHLEYRMTHEPPVVDDEERVLLAVAFVMRPDEGGASGGVDVHIEHGDRQPQFLPWEALELLFSSGCAEAIEHCRQSWQARIAEN